MNERDKITQAGGGTREGARSQKSEDSWCKSSHLDARRLERARRRAVAAELEAARAVRRAAREARRGRPPAFVVYFIRVDGTDDVKIGKTSLPIEVRVSSLQTGNPRTLVVEALLAFPDADTMAAAERRLHGRFAERRISGEWFRLTRADVGAAADASSQAIRWATGHSAPSARSLLALARVTGIPAVELVINSEAA